MSEFASDPRDLLRWASGLAGGEVQREATQWSMSPPMERVLALVASRCEVAPTLRRGLMSETLMSGGMANAGISERQFIGWGALEKHTQRLRAKLGLGEGASGHRLVTAMLTLLGGT